MVSKSNQKQNILLVEDDFHTAKILKLNLERVGYEIDVATDGTSALKKLGNQVPDLIISDIMMPGTDGISFRNKLLLNTEHRIIPFIFLRTSVLYFSLIPSANVSTQSLFWMKW